jgi:hypothetical protein
MAQSPEEAARDGEMVEISLKFPRGTGSPTDDRDGVWTMLEK